MILLTVLPLNSTHTHPYKLTLTYNLNTINESRREQLTLDGMRFIQHNNKLDEAVNALLMSANTYEG